MNCTKCKYFQSFYEAYNFDENEPNNLGFCLNEKSKLYFNNGASEEKVCELFEQKKLISLTGKAL